MTVGKALAGLATAAGATAASCLAYGAFIEPTSFTLRRVEVPILPPGRASITILHVSDLHLLPSQKAKIAWVQSLAAHKPDLVVNTGDNLSTPDGLAALGSIFAPLAGIPGVFVLGSNDIFAPAPINPLKYFRPPRRAAPPPVLPTADIVTTLEGLGWTNVQERCVCFTLGDTKIEVRGCGDAHIGLDDYPQVMSQPHCAERLLTVTHAPYRRVLDQMVADGSSLILAGHTHGGQVCWPTGRALTTNCDLPVEKAKGLSTHLAPAGSAYLHVSAGLGTSPYAPYRFACPPEATLLTLTPASGRR